MRIGISLKWTVSAVVVVIIVVSVYAFFMINDTQQSVARETERITNIQNDALDQLGAQTTQAISQPASGLLYDNDRDGLYKLISPVVEGREGGGYSAVYTTLIAPNGRVWATAVADEIRTLEMADSKFFDRWRDEQVVEEVSSDWLKSAITSQKLPQAFDVERAVETTKGDAKKIKIREYIVAIEGSDEIQGYLLIGYSIDRLIAEIEKIQQDGEIRKDDALSRSLWLALIAIMIGLIIGGMQSLLVTSNIKKLSKAASQIASGDLSVRSDVKSRDEIGQLGEQFNTMADRVQELLHETEQKAMLEKEVDIARSIQTTLLPPTGYAECGPVRLNGYFQPASVCGGDFWSYNRLPDGSVLLTIGDVTGHGVPSAMITACAKSSLDTILNISGNQLNLAGMVASINDAICRTAKRTLFMTFLAMRISADGRSFEMVNAGHNFPLINRNGEVRGLVARGERLGDNPNATYTAIRDNLMPGDMLLLFTDGLIEYLNEAGAEYGEKRLRKVIAPFVRNNVNDAMQLLWNDFQSFCGNAPQADDITLMFAQV